MAPRPFEGLKVADFSWVGVGPITTRYLADYGATVIRVESVKRPDFLRTAAPFPSWEPGINRSGFFANYNGGKMSASLNLKHPGAMEVARRFIAWADVFAESFTAGTIERLGLGYDEVSKVNPGIIYFSSTNQGQTGTYRMQPGFGTQLVSLAGFTQIIGWPDGEPCGTYGAYTDFISPRYGIALVAAALDRRRKTGEGMRIDLSQLESGLQFLAPLLLDFTANGRVAGRVGNRSIAAAPHNAYPCAGEDRWCVIAAMNDGHWHALRRAMGDPQWAASATFATLIGRKRNEDRLDELIGRWTRGFEAQALMRMLQSAGVPAGVVQTSQELFSDEQLKFRRHFSFETHPEIGVHAYDNFAPRLSDTPGSVTGPAPCLGEHNDLVYSEILGYTDKEITRLSAEGVLD